MEETISFEYDVEGQVLIMLSRKAAPKIIEKNNLVWRILVPKMNHMLEQYI